MTHLDDLVLQVRLRFRMAPPQSFEDMRGAIDFLLILVRLGGRVLQERKAHAEALARATGEFEAASQSGRP